jgi:aspartate aminotransferase-like enzyme
MEKPFTPNEVKKKNKKQKLNFLTMAENSTMMLQQFSNINALFRKHGCPN